VCTSPLTSVGRGFGFAELVQSLVQEVLKVQVNHACGLDLRFMCMPTVDEVKKSVMVYEDAFWIAPWNAILSGTCCMKLSGGSSLLPAPRHQAFFTRWGPRGTFRP